MKNRKKHGVLGSTPGRASQGRRSCRRPLFFEPLEQRNLLTATLGDGQLDFTDESILEGTEYLASCAVVEQDDHGLLFCKVSDSVSADFESDDVVADIVQGDAFTIAVSNSLNQFAAQHGGFTLAVTDDDHRNSVAGLIAESADGQVLDNTLTFDAENNSGTLRFSLADSSVVTDEVLPAAGARVTIDVVVSPLATIGPEPNPSPPSSGGIQPLEPVLGLTLPPLDVPSSARPSVETGTLVTGLAIPIPSPATSSIGIDSTMDRGQIFAVESAPFTSPWDTGVSASVTRAPLGNTFLAHGFGFLRESLTTRVTPGIRTAIVHASLDTYTIPTRRGNSSFTAPRGPRAEHLELWRDFRSSLRVADHPLEFAIDKIAHERVLLGIDDGEETTTVPLRRWADHTEPIRLELQRDRRDETPTRQYLLPIALLGLFKSLSIAIDPKLP